jgi:hypothetical protein
LIGSCGAIESDRRVDSIPVPGALAVWLEAVGWLKQDGNV